MGIKSVSSQTLQRLPAYLHYLQSLPKEKILNVSAKSIADSMGLGEIQVRKDLAVVSGGGKPRIGYIKEDLIKDIQAYLGYGNVTDAVLVGAGKLGRALISYDGFKEYGLNIVAAFDTDENIIDTLENGKRVFPVSKLKELCERLKIRMGIITVPAVSSQEVCDMLVSAGILAIWNFTPSHLKVLDNILVKNENMAASFAILSKHLTEKLS